MRSVHSFHRLMILGVSVAAVSSCKSKPPAAEPPRDARRGAEAADAGVASSRARATSDGVEAPVVRTPSLLLETGDAGGAAAGASESSAKTIERVRALESYKRLAEVPVTVDQLAHRKEWDKALEAIRAVDGLGKRIKDESQEFVTRAGPEALDFMTKLATFVIDARTELSMVEVDRTPEQREKSVKRFVEIGKAVFR